MLTFKKVPLQQIKKIKNYYQQFDKGFNKPNCKIFKYQNCTITIYTNQTITFQGNNFEVESNKHFQAQAKKLSKQKDNMKIVGTDETGVGDFFGPIVVSAVYIPSKNFAELLKLPIQDSKKISNQKIKSLKKQIEKLINFKCYIMTNETYNINWNKYHNTHIIKTIGHTNVIFNLLNYLNLKNQSYSKIIVDGFTTKINWIKYCQKIKVHNLNQNNIYLISKAENKFLAVACASIISRFYFLQEIEILKKKYQLDVPLGASKKVQDYVKKIKTNYPLDIQNKLLKLHFKTD